MFNENELVSTEIDDITISACPTLIEADKSAKEFLWGYYLCIENNSDHTISLLGKDWNITDDAGHSYRDDSAGFKGEIPDLEPGEFFEFTSTAPLNTTNAVFYGSCRIRFAAEEKNIKIPTFQFSAGAEARILN